MAIIDCPLLPLPPVFQKEEDVQLLGAHLISLDLCFAPSILDFHEIPDS